MDMNPAEWCGTTHRRQDIRPRRGSRRESSLHLEGSRGDQRLVRVCHGTTSTTVPGAASPPEEVFHCMVLQRRAGAGRDAVPTHWREGPAGGGLRRADPVAGAAESLRRTLRAR